MRKQQAWTADQDAALRESYAAGGIASAQAALPGRSYNSIMRRAQRLGLTKRRRWTKADDDNLRMLWGGGFTLARIAQTLKRSQITTYWRAQRLGLPLGCPQGWEYLTTAADRTGYTTDQLRAILAWAGMRLHRSLARPSAKRRGRGLRNGTRFWIVMPDEVDEAIERWNQTEPVEAAARRRGTYGAALKEKLIAAGFVPPPRPRVHWRVTDEMVEKAMGAAA